MNLDQTVGVVTGATGGIGQAVAMALAQRRSRLVITGRRVARLATVADAIAQRGGEVVAVDGDIASAATSRSAVDAALSRFGRLDVLVNAAGFGPPASLVDVSEAMWDATIDSCLKGSYLMTRAVLPTMLAARAGCVVYVSSIAGKAVEAKRTAYCAAEWGLQGFALALKDELAGTGVRVHLVNPANVATDWWRTTDDPQHAEVLQRMLAPQDVAEAVVWMLTQPEHVHVTEVLLGNARNPWST
jgi:3-oxoacyl-[acyl-carrier protein] reductase